MLIGIAERLCIWTSCAVVYLLQIRESVGQPRIARGGVDILAVHRHQIEEPTRSKCTRPTNQATNVSNHDLAASWCITGSVRVGIANDRQSYRASTTSRDSSTSARITSTAANEIWTSLASQHRCQFAHDKTDQTRSRATQSTTVHTSIQQRLGRNRPGCFVWRCCCSDSGFVCCWSIGWLATEQHADERTRAWTSCRSSSGKQRRKTPATTNHERTTCGCCHRHHSTCSACQQCGSWKWHEWKCAVNATSGTSWRQRRSSCNATDCAPSGRTSSSSCSVVESATATGTSTTACACACKTWPACIEWNATTRTYHATTWSRCRSVDTSVCFDCNATTRSRTSNASDYLLDATNDSSIGATHK
mmetsp:Transcript_24655/g.39071  ORF Transcript_24655/g.39071 Transcript_24655/m.39071 type:complete len:362 (+) Transcript_24655:1119-2204(+)